MRQLIDANISIYRFAAWSLVWLGARGQPFLSGADSVHALPPIDEQPATQQRS